MSKTSDSSVALRAERLNLVPPSGRGVAQTTMEDTVANTGPGLTEGVDTVGPSGREGPIPVDDPGGALVGEEVSLRDKTVNERLTGIRSVRWGGSDKGVDILPL